MGDESIFYACSQCRRPLEFAKVDEIRYFVASGGAYWVYIRYACCCTPGNLCLNTSYPANRHAMRRLCGAINPLLPYRAAGAGAGFLFIWPGYEALCSKFGNSWAYIKTPEDFFDLCSGSDDGDDE